MADLVSETTTAPEASTEETTTEQTTEKVETVEPTPTPEEKVAAADKAKADKDAKERQRLEARFDYANRQAKILRARDEKLKEREAKYSGFEEKLSRLKDDPLAVLQEVAGLDYESLTKLYLKKLDQAEQQGVAPKSDPEIKVIKEEIARQKAEKAEQEKKDREQKLAADWTEHINDVTNYVRANADTYEVILSEPSRATELYRQIFRETCKIIEAKEGSPRDPDRDEIISALNRTEELMAEEATAKLEQLIKTKKFAARFAPVKEPVETLKPKDESKPLVASKKTTKPRTLSNDLSTGPTPPAAKATSSKEIWERKLEQIKRKYG